MVPLTDDARMTVVLVAHDNRKQDLCAWARFNRQTLADCRIYATRSTGQALIGEVGLDVHCLLSGPLGGDAQIGYDVPIACNRSSADFLISSPLMRDFRRYRETRGRLAPGVGVPISLPAPR